MAAPTESRMAVPKEGASACVMVTTRALESARPKEVARARGLARKRATHSVAMTAGRSAGSSARLWASLTARRRRAREGGGVVGGAVGEGEGFCVGALVALGQYCVGQGVIVTLAKARARAARPCVRTQNRGSFEQLSADSGLTTSESMALRNTGAAGRKPPPPPPGVAPWRTNRLRHADDENSAMSVRVLVHGLTYHVTVPRHGTFGWLMSEVIRRWMEEHDSDPQIAGRARLSATGVSSSIPRTRSAIFASLTRSSWRWRTRARAHRRRARSPAAPARGARDPATIPRLPVLVVSMSPSAPSKAPGHGRA